MPGPFSRDYYYSGGGAGTKYRGRTAIGNGADSVTVTGQAFPTVPSQVIATVNKPSGAYNLFCTVRNDSISTDGFTVDLSAATDSGSYSIDWMAVL